ncbi:unnamed protein product [Lymnaea stagnalis]|uniref:TGF-beta propeptide domain-containing protein n=1 Tax=Lymnaea stagnalis TaxID=6523 RepID=A0AAV2I1J9_LYMST
MKHRLSLPGLSVVLILSISCPLHNFLAAAQVQSRESNHPHPRFSYQIIDPGQSGGSKTASGAARQELYNEEDGDDDEFLEEQGAATTASSLPVSVAAVVDLETSREREKQARTRLAKERIQPASQSENLQKHKQMVYDRFRNEINMFLNWSPATQYRNCYLAACTAPKSISDLLWRNTSHPGMKLHFTLPRFDKKRDVLELKSAKLRLFVKPRKDCPCFDEDNEEIVQYLVTVYQFIRPLSIRKRNRVVYKQKILNAIMIPARGNAWISLDIMRAVSTWIKKSRKNFGVEVMVQGVYGEPVRASDIFVLPDCSSATERTCEDDRGDTIRPVVWTPKMTSDRVVNANTPYLDVVVINRTMDLAIERMVSDMNQAFQQQIKSDDVDT